MSAAGSSSPSGSIAERKAHFEAAQAARIAKAEKREQRKLENGGTGDLSSESASTSHSLSGYSENLSPLTSAGGSAILGHEQRGLDGEITTPIIAAPVELTATTVPPKRTPSFGRAGSPAAFQEAQSLLEEITSYVVHTNTTNSSGSPTGCGSPRIDMSRSAAVTEDTDLQQQLTSSSQQTPAEGENWVVNQDQKNTTVGDNSCPTASPCAPVSTPKKDLEAENADLRRRLEKLEGSLEGRKEPVIQEEGEGKYEEATPNASAILSVNTSREGKYDDADGVVVPPSPPLPLLSAFDDTSFRSRSRGGGGEEGVTATNKAYPPVSTRTIKNGARMGVGDETVETTENVSSINSTGSSPTKGEYKIHIGKSLNDVRHQVEAQWRLRERKKAAAAETQKDYYLQSYGRYQQRRFDDSIATLTTNGSPSHYSSPFSPFSSAPSPSHRRSSPIRAPTRLAQSTPPLIEQSSWESRATVLGGSQLTSTVSADRDTSVHHVTAAVSPPVATAAAAAIMATTGSTPNKETRLTGSVGSAQKYTTPSSSKKLGRMLRV